MIVTGTVKWFDNKKGYGFLRCQECEEDIFIHFSNILGDGFKCLRGGEVVELDLVKGEKGFHGLSVSKVEDPARTSTPEQVA